MHIARLPVLHDGEAHNDGPATTRRGCDGGENYARNSYVQAGKTANGRIRVSESHNHVNSE